MTNAERAASAINVRKVSWNGINVKKDVPKVLQLGEPFVQHQRRTPHPDVRHRRRSAPR